MNGASNPFNPKPLRGAASPGGFGGLSAVVANIDDDFYTRADAVIHLVNDQLAGVSRGKVSASCMYATARFNAWIAACRHGAAEDMAAARQDTIEYFVKQYRAMLEENVDDYIDNFDRYMRSRGA